VAVRRLRSDLRSFRELVDAQWSDPLRQELRWLGTELGAVRDLDVFIGRLGADATRVGGADDPGVAALISAAREMRAGMHARLTATLRSQRYAELRDRLCRAARAPRFTLAARLHAEEAIGPVIRRRYKRVRDAVNDLPQRPPLRQLHRVRIFAKRLRYASEAAALVAGRDASHLAERAEALQEALGELNDADIACATLRRLRRRPELALPANALLSLELEAAARARAAWPAVWHALSRKEVRAWL
ncbi:MAG TPA: CHAD domain-containing protein, partial [Caldimonas sp.]|nr:CHAD domain-containing protein [Caldimonas sp.]